MEDSNWGRAPVLFGTPTPGAGAMFGRANTQPVQCREKAETEEVAAFVFSQSLTQTLLLTEYLDVLFHSYFFLMKELKG